MKLLRPFHNHSTLHNFKRGLCSFVDIFWPVIVRKLKLPIQSVGSALTPLAKALLRVAEIGKERIR